MAWTSGFFNSNNGDRVYNSEHLSDIFSGLITDGVYESIGNKLAVQHNSGMVVHINTGKGWFYNKWVENDAPYLITLEDSDVTLNRYAAVGIRVDRNNSVRNAVPFVKYSAFASSPVKPVPERSELVREYVLAYVYIKAGVNEIKASAIEDTRGNTELCGWVTGLIKQLDTTTLFEQYDAIFKEWFNELGDYLEDDVEAKLVYDVSQLKGKVLKTTSILSKSGWTSQNEVYTQTVEFNGVTTDSDVMISPKNESAYINANCRATSQGYHTITFECNAVPAVDIVIDIIIFNVDTLADVIVESVNTWSVTDDDNGHVTIVD